MKTKAIQVIVDRMSIDDKNAILLMGKEPSWGEGWLAVYERYPNLIRGMELGPQRVSFKLTKNGLTAKRLITAIKK